MSELNYDQPSLWDDGGTLATVLEERGHVAFAYGAFGTRHAMMAINAICFADAYGQTDVPWFASAPEGIGDPQDNRYTLWLRQSGPNQHTGSWMIRGGNHVPPYVAEKLLNDNPIDGIGLGTMIEIIEAHRRGDGRESVEASTEQWITRTESSLNGARDFERPAFITQPDQEPLRRIK